MNMSTQTEKPITIEPGESVTFTVPIEPPKDAEKLCRAMNGTYSESFHDWLFTRRISKLTKEPANWRGRFMWHMLGGERYWKLKKEPCTVMTCEK